MFYREAWDERAPTIVLLHGFPTSSHMYRNLIPLLAKNFHVIAPDFIGFGYSDALDAADFSYTFDNLARLAKLPVSSVFRAMTISETRGFMKALIDTESDRTLGFTMFGASTGKVMTTVQMTMLAGSPYTALRDAVITHSTCRKGSFSSC